MNVPFYKTINVFLCISSLFPIIPNSAGLLKGKRQCSGENHKFLRPTMTINMSDSRGKRHNLPLVGVDNVDLHRIATCTKAPGRLVCKSGRYNYVINNGNFEFPAETLEKFVSALYQKAKDKESDFAVSLVAPEKESTSSVSHLHSTLPTYYAKMTTESADQLQPVTIECELTDAKKLKETNPDYQPKPNEKVFKCNTKRLGVKRKRNAPQVSINQDQTVNTIGTKVRSLRTDIDDGPRRKRSQISQHQWKLYQPFAKLMGQHSLRTRSLSSIPERRLRDIVRKTGFGSLFHKSEDEGNENEKDVAGIFHRDSPRPRVRIYNYSCGEGQGQRSGWCPPLRSTACLAQKCTLITTLHPTYYTLSPGDDCPDQERRIRRLAYKFRNPLMEFFMPYGLRSFTKGEAPHCTGCACSRSTTQHVCTENSHSTLSEETTLSRKIIIEDEDEEVLTPSEDEYCDSPVSADESKCKCKCSQHRKHSEKHECGKQHKQFANKQGSIEEYNSDEKTEKNVMKESKRRFNLMGGHGCQGGCECELRYCECSPPKRKIPKCTTKHTTTTKRTRSTVCAVITQRICIGLQGEHRTCEPTVDGFQSISETKNQLERPPYSK